MKALIKNRLLFLFFTLLILLTVIFISYKYFMTSFITIEKEINKRNINSIVSIMNNSLRNLENITIDYAKWDDTYNYIKTKDYEYINENFREGTNTLEDLEIDFMIFTDLKNRKVFSKHSESSVLKNNSDFEKDFLKSFETRSDFATVHKSNSLILKHKTFYLLITKASISNSDNTKNSIGFLYSGKVISNDILNGMTKVFHDVKLTEKVLDNNSVIIDSDLLKNIRIHTIIDDECDCLKNIVQFYNYKNEFVFSIVTNTKRNLINIGKEAIYSYNLVIGGFLIFVAFLLYKNYMFLKSYNQRLIKDVERKTEDLKKTNIKLKILSETDELTKIHNRRNFFKLGERALKKSIDNLDDLSVVMMDIDDFKKINDTYGHDVGDKILIGFTKIISDTLDQKHIFGRLGGEEFAIVLVNTDLEKAFIIAEEIRKKVSNSTVNIDSQKITYTISLGVSYKDIKNSLDDILKEADDLLYKSKKSGKNKSSIRDRKTIS